VFVVLFVVLLSAVVAHGDMKRKGNRDASRRGGVKHEFVPARVPFQVFPVSKHSKGSHMVCHFREH
jgi:hypothetical protein